LNFVTQQMQKHAGIQRSLVASSIQLRIPQGQSMSQAHWLRGVALKTCGVSDELMSPDSTPGRTEDHGAEIITTHPR
jgi:hypothetical protein